MYRCQSPLLRLFAVALLSVPSSFLYAQNRIEGLVSDSAGKGVPFVNIALLRLTDSVQVKGTISNEDGHYELSVAGQGNYLLRFFSVTYRSCYSQPFTMDGVSTLNVPPVVLRAEGLQLGEVAVTAIQKVVEFKNGMTVLHVENSIMAAGNTVLDVLKRIPGVTVDHQNNISISGKQGVGVMLDGRLQQLSMEQLVAMMSAMSADQLSRIEVIKNPPAKYDAGGNAGIINLVTRKAGVRGYSGSIMYNPGMGQRFGNSIYAVLNFKSRRWTVFSNINPMYKTFFDRYDYHKRVSYQGKTTMFDHTGYHENLRRYISGKVGADYALSKKTTIGMSLSGAINDARPEERGYVAIGGFNDLGFDHYSYLTEERSLWTNPAYNLNAEHQFDTLGTKLSFSLDYTGFRNSADRRSESVFLNNGDMQVKASQAYASVSDGHIGVFTQKLDFQRYLKPQWLMEMGLKTTFVNSRSGFVFSRQDTLTGAYLRDTSFSNDYRYAERIVAGYITLRKEFTRGSLAAGFRAEQTRVSGHNLTNGFQLTREYLNFFPTFSLDYQLSERHSLQFNYGRRLDRPDYAQLNPFRRFEDQYAVAAGNPYLNPQYSHNLDLVHVCNQWMTNSIGYARLTNLFADVSVQDDRTKVTTFLPANIAQGDYAYYNLFLQRQAKPWWRFECSVNVFYVSYRSKIEGVQLNTETWSTNIYLNNDIVLPKDFKIQLTAHYNAPVVSGPSYNKANGSCDIGFKKTLLKGKFNVMIQLLDMFYTDVSRSVYNFGNQYYTFNQRDDTRRFRLTLSYKFGQMNIHVAEKRSNDPEQKRLQNN